jgi:type II secretory pathway pseudopilin PulG
MSTKHSLMSVMIASVSALALEPAIAQSVSNSEKIEQLQRQTETLEKQLKALKQEMAETKKKTERVEAAQVGYAAQAAAGDPTKGPIAKASPWPSGVKVTLGGFVAAETVFRSRNEVADIGSSFNAIPYPFSPQFGENEFHGSARQSRLSILAEGDLDPIQKLSGYFEMDFLGVGATSNYNESNSWAPRLRQGYATYDNSDWGFHFLAGQAWSLLTQNTAGITPRKENVPLTIDASYVVGFDYTRNWQIRVVKDFGQLAALGISVENPATIIDGGQVVGNTINGLVINDANAGGSFLGSSGFANRFTTDLAPDIIEKAAFDPGWGHYEVFGLQRFFTDSTFCATTAPTGCLLGTAKSNTSFGEGVGGSVLLPLIPKYLDAQASILYGRGVGRYGAGQLSDVTIAPDGSLAPITATHALVGLVGHPWEGTDIYAYGGLERADSKFFSAGGAPFGYGNPAFSNAACLLTTAASFNGTTPAGCVADNRSLTEFTVGVWQNVYKGPYGRVAVGAEYEYIRREAFNGVGGAPSTDDNIGMTSIRYYPF